MAHRSDASDGKGTVIGPRAYTPQSPSARSDTDTMKDGVYITIMATFDGQVVESCCVAELNLEYGVRVLGFASTPNDVAAANNCTHVMMVPMEPRKVGGSSIMFKFFARGPTEVAFGLDCQSVPILRELC